MQEIRQRFATITDPRHPGYVKHNLADILIMVMGGVICGITELADMMVYFEKKLPFYREHFGIEKYPSKPTLSRVLGMVNGAEVGKVLIELMHSSICKEGLGNILAVDGKAFRSTDKSDSPRSFLQMLTVYATESGVTLGQEAIHYEDKTNEIPVFQKMLECLQITGRTITADAMHCQVETCRRITEKGGDYLIGLKGNQKSMYEAAELFFSDEINRDAIKQAETLEKGSGRIERRVCRATEETDSWLTNKKEWSGLKSVIAITRTVTAKGKTTVETSYYISSLPCDAEKFLSIARQHWMIESMHWSLDVIWNEDGTMLQSDNGLKTLNSFRKLALLAHKRYVSTLPKKKSVKSNVLSALLDDSLALSVMEML